MTDPPLLVKTLVLRSSYQPATRGKKCVSHVLSILRFRIGQVGCWLLGSSVVHIKTVFLNGCEFAAL